MVPMSRSWQATGKWVSTEARQPPGRMGDFNGDGRVDGSDVTILAGNWQYGVDVAAAAAPEPSAILLFLSAITAVTLLRSQK